MGKTRFRVTCSFQLSLSCPCVPVLSRWKVQPGCLQLSECFEQFSDGSVSQSVLIEVGCSAPPGWKDLLSSVGRRLNSLPRAAKAHLCVMLPDLSLTLTLSCSGLGPVLRFTAAASLSIMPQHWDCVVAAV